MPGAGRREDEGGGERGDGEGGEGALGAARAAADVRRCCAGVAGGGEVQERGVGEGGEGVGQALAAG